MANVFEQARKSAARTTGQTMQLEPSQAYAMYAYTLRTKCGIDLTSGEKVDATAPWAVLEAKNIGEFGACGRSGRDLAAGNMHFYTRGSVVPSPNVSVPPISVLTDQDWKAGRRFQEIFAKNVVEQSADVELPLDVEVEQNA